MSDGIFRAINVSNIETIDVIEKTLDENWIYTDTLYWNSAFRNKQKHTSVDLKWYNLKDFKYNRIFADNIKESVRSTMQFSTDEELLECLCNTKFSEGTNKYTIIDRKLYIKPRIKITFISGQNQYIYFDSTSKAIEYIGELKRKMDKETLIYC